MNRSDSFGEKKEFFIDSMKNMLQQQICDKVNVCELSGELVLPDYMPEIKRLLRVTPHIRPASRYVIPGSVSFAGCVDFEMLYTDNDGAPHSARHICDYEFECEIGSADADIKSESIFCDLELESLSCRPVGPRKFMVRSRLRSRVRAFSDTEISEDISCADGAGEGHSIERLTSAYPSIRVARAHGEEFTVSEDVTLDDGTARVVSYDGAVHVSGISVSDGTVDIRGEVSVRCLLEKEGGELYTLVRRAPFSESVLLEGARQGCDCMACGHISTIDVAVDSFEDGRATLSYQVSAVPEAWVQTNADVCVCEDAFSTRYESECERKTLEIPRAISTQSANVAASCSIALADVGIPADCTVIDSAATAKLESVSVLHGRYVGTGVCHISLLFRGEMLDCSEFDIPFSAVLEGKADGDCLFDAETTVNSVRCRIEGENLSADAELSLAVSLYKKDRTEAVEKIKLVRDMTNTAKSGASVTVCYPDAKERIWDVAKRYSVSPVSIIGTNSVELTSVARAVGIDFVVFEN